MMRCAGPPPLGGVPDEVRNPVIKPDDQDSPWGLARSRSRAPSVVNGLRARRDELTCLRFVPGGSAGTDQEPAVARRSSMRQTHPYGGNPCW